MLRVILFGSVSLSSYLSWRSRWFIKHPVIIKHSLIVCECVCLCAGVSPGNYLMLRSLMTTQTNICPQVIYKMRGWPSVVLASVSVHVRAWWLARHSKCTPDARTCTLKMFCGETLPHRCCSSTQTITKTLSAHAIPSERAHTHPLRAHAGQLSPADDRRVMPQEQIFTSQASDPNK